MTLSLDNLKLRLENTIHIEPIVGSLPLYVNKVLTGIIHPNALKAIEHYQGFNIQGENAYLDLTSHDFQGRTDFFNQLAHHLLEQSCLHFWRDEQVVVWREQSAFAHIERTATRPLGLLTQAIHMNAWTPEGKIFLSLRSPTKQTDPNKWDTLSGGLLNAHDTLESGLIRETFEEAGLRESQLTLRTDIRSIDTVRRPLPEGYQVEEILTSDCILEPHIHPQNQDGEVSEIRIFSIDEVIQLMCNDQVTAEAMVVLINSIENNIFKTIR
ncbi:DUF4743 domain-containing protein [Pelistega sp. MC2]|uniref:NUDIX hydrolase n=1 Tax=Pelistega sp. MC2 TaxID=1720297 RepID=UPI00115F7D9D|nr:DUF4743 domain-containing protein [Pelistega sp. MC2]